MTRRVAGMAVVGTLVAGCTGALPEPVDLLLINANVYTLNWPDPASDGTPSPDAPYSASEGWHADAQAVGVRGGRIVFVGGERQHVAAFRQGLPSAAYQPVAVGDTTYWAFTKVVHMSTVGKVRLTISMDNPALTGDPRYLVTRQLHWNAGTILNAYDKRRQTEPFYRDEKHHLGFEACQLRDEPGTIRHWYLTFLAYSLCQLQIALSRPGKGAKANLKTVGDCCRQANDELVRALVLYIGHRLDQGESPEALLHNLFGNLSAR